MKAGALLTLAVLLPCALSAQGVPPSGLDEVELARSRACVGALSGLEELNRTLEPFAVRMERLRALGRAISLEDRSEVEPFDAADSVEVAVSEWFTRDSALAARWVAERDTAIQVERRGLRDAILERVRLSAQAVGAEAQELLGDAAEVENTARPCEGAILVRSAVIEACGSSQASVCQAAAASEIHPDYRFVDAPSDLWDVSNFRPWSQPGPLQITPQGALVGARTAARARRGNIVVSVGLAPLIQNRADLSEEEVREFDSNLDSLGFTFEHPKLVMAPAIEFSANVPKPMDGETHLLLHFGDLSGSDVIWSTEIAEGGVFQAVFPASAVNLARLQAGETVSLTAVRVPEGEGNEADAIWSVSLLAVNQAQYVQALVQYMGGGGLAEDLAALLPPSDTGGTSEP